jgi:hypothetical protein
MTVISMFRVDLVDFNGKNNFYISVVPLVFLLVVPLVFLFGLSLDLGVLRSRFCPLPVTTVGSLPR